MQHVLLPGGTINNYVINNAEEKEIRPRLTTFGRQIVHYIVQRACTCTPRCNKGCLRSVKQFNLNLVESLRRPNLDRKVAIPRQSFKTSTLALGKGQV